MHGLMMLTLMVALVAPAPVQSAPAASPPEFLSSLGDEVSAALLNLDRGAEACARAVELATGGEFEVRQILELVSTHDPSIVSCCWIDAGGVLRWIEPATWKSNEGADLSGQQAVRQVRRTRAPVLGGSFRTVERIDVIDLEFPVAKTPADLAGSISILFRPDVLLDRIIRPRVEGTGWNALVVETTGRIIYGSDPAPTGTDLLSDGPFNADPAFVEIGRRILAESWGDGASSLTASASGTPAELETHWRSVGLHGTDWRLILMRGAGGN